ncbi:MAG: glutamate--tRNA ligase [Candidatus Moraniibacteriota bacterium]
MDDNKKVRVRFAPSPTGFIHIGNLRTVLFGYLFAKKNNGTFVVRIEDTDQSREVAGSLKKVLEMLQWINLTTDEGAMLDEKNNVIEKGDYGPYIQSNRLELYRKYAQELIEKDKAYPCFCSEERLKQMREDQQKDGVAPKYDGCCRKLSQTEAQEKIANGEKYVIRMKIPENETVKFTDLVYGDIKIESDNIDDQVLMKSDGFPTYFLAVVVDDHLMEISHIFRGDDWISSAPKLVLLYDFFGWDIPAFVHVPNVISNNGKKLSKRRDSVSVEQFKTDGYLPEALVNFLALLGWNPGAGETQEIFSIDEIIQRFDLGHVHKAGAVFDLKKLDWINGQYIKKLSIDDLYKQALPFFEQKDFYQKAGTEKKSSDFLKRVLTVELDRLPKLSDVGENNQFFFATNLQYEKSLLRWKEMSDAELKETLEKAKNILENISAENWTKENLEKNLMEAAGDRRGELLWPLRAALTGAQKSPSPFEVAWVLGKTESLRRIEKALAL